MPGERDDHLPALPEGRLRARGPREAALENEHSDIGITTPNGSLLTRQIAGSVARRIVTDHEVGAVVTQGERLRPDPVWLAGRRAFPDDRKNSRQAKET